MEFRHPDGRHLSVLLPNLSVLVMTGESRYVWSHGITPRKSDIIPSKEGGLTLSQRGLRTSFTFRKITGVRPENIDSAQPSVPTDNHSASQLESQHVHQVYEEIAEHFSGTRHTPWPHIADFLHEQAPGSLLADIGCGNGKYFGINKSLFELGSDRSFNLAGICKERGYQIYVGDVLAVPLRAGVFDVCLCIAVIHHMSTQERRQKAVAELLKILRPGGKALIYVWAIEQELNKIKSKHLKDKQNTQQLEERVSSQLLMKDTHPCASDIIDVNEDTNLDEKKHVNEQEVGYSKRDTGVINSALESKHTIQPLADMQSTQSSNDRYKMCDNDADRQVECCTSDDVLNSSSQAKDKPQKLEVHINRTCFKQQDVLVPWQLKSKTENQDADNLQNTFHRFYHVFRQGELEDLCRSVGCCKVLKSYYDQGNWAVIVEKQ
ncbi:hypothetical protein DPMN_108015 [Dreissena polymorpha]|uniref:Methyltransferase type 11 domain-containing protein n=2 Tax=Dreissena polymorpha TaxID=45954 RepID=A0A9D4K7R9_DREPO|nr:hypothetical protein DPMN_108015 [Dreissena polymorpha]